MKPRISVFTLGVSDLARSRTFYVDGLGWKASSTSDEHIVFIDMGDVVLGLYPRDLLARANASKMEHIRSLTCAS